MVRDDLARGAKKAAVEDATVVFVDEVRSSLKGVTGTTWAPVGQTPEVMHCCRWDKLSTVGGISYDGQVFTQTYPHSIRKEQVVAFLGHSTSLASSWSSGTVHPSTVQGPSRIT